MVQPCKYGGGGGGGDGGVGMHAQLSVAYVNKQINQISAKPPLKFDGDLARFGLTS